MADHSEKRNPVDEVRRYVRDNPFTTVVGSWALILGGTFGYLYNKQIPTQLKVIQGRIVAQAALLSGAGLAAAYHFIVEEPAGKKHGSQHAAIGHVPVAKYKSFDLDPEEQQAHAAAAHAHGAQPKLQ